MYHILRLVAIQWTVDEHFYGRPME